VRRVNIIRYFCYKGNIISLKKFIRTYKKSKTIMIYELFSDLNEIYTK